MDIAFPSWKITLPDYVDTKVCFVQRRHRGSSGT
jgi:hypothetical protein